MRELMAFEAIIAELLAMVRDGVLLRSFVLLPERNWLIIGDFALAEEYAYRRYTDDSDDGLSWTDLRAIEASKLLRSTYNDPAGWLRAEVRGLAGRFTEELMERLPPPYRPIADDVAADLRNIALSRAVPEAGSGLFRQVWDAYRLGSWPCGWEGSYPAGRLVVFQPSRASL